jgi:diadenosine tetraphosphate (Ap4A) HIT family hydrolase
MSTTTDPFALDPRLAADCILVADLPVSRLLLMNDSRFPWCILVPRVAGLRELHDLARPARAALLDEIETVSRGLIGLGGVDKINVGALGNLVPQLHVHVVGRRPGDAAWPRPVWGSGSAAPYAEAEWKSLRERLREAVAPRSARR